MVINLLTGASRSRPGPSVAKTLFRGESQTTENTRSDWGGFRWGEIRCFVTVAINRKNRRAILKVDVSIQFCGKSGNHVQVLRVARPHVALPNPAYSNSVWVWSKVNVYAQTVSHKWDPRGGLDRTRTTITRLRTPT